MTHLAGSQLGGEQVAALNRAGKPAGCRAQACHRPDAAGATAHLTLPGVCDLRTMDSWLGPFHGSTLRRGSVATSGNRRREPPLRPEAEPFYGRKRQTLAAARLL